MTRLDCKGRTATWSSLTVVSTSLPTEQGVSRSGSGFCGQDHKIDPAKAESALGRFCCKSSLKRLPNRDSVSFVRTSTGGG